VRAFITNGLGSAPGAGGARAVMAVLALPSSSLAPTAVTIVEYYNAQLDHYFITAIPDEITKLDNGTFVGWQRTGQEFRAYGIGSSGRTGRRPVCREYGNPAANLNSHFYSASPDECAATLVNGGGFSWLLEANEVFEMDLPDPVTGACPAGGVPIYRIFNQRKDANHRYTTSLAIRDQMVAKGGVAEGYGPNAVALCGLQ
jgi:serine protease